MVRVDNNDARSGSMASSTVTIELRRLFFKQKYNIPRPADGRAQRDGENLQRSLNTARILPYYVYKLGVVVVARVLYERSRCTKRVR